MAYLNRVNHTRAQQHGWIDCSDTHMTTRATTATTTTTTTNIGTTRTVTPDQPHNTSTNGTTRTVTPVMTLPYSVAHFADTKHDADIASART